MSKNLYIVMHDFTAVGDAALNYALHLGKRVNTEIKLIHLVSTSSEETKANSKVDEIISKTDLPSGVKLSKFVGVGSIFDDISTIAKSEGAQLIIMGTHGALGMQKVFGSKAMKVVTSAETPFLIIQKDTVIKDVKNILVPIDLTKESLQIINIAGDLARIVGDATVHVVGEKQNDDLLNQQMKNRILIVKNQYDDRQVDCKVEFMTGSGSYQKKILSYCSDKSIDLIGIAYHSESLLPQFDTFAQSLITNDSKLPCLVLNSKLASALYF
jgi:nucleotide-binding universal stress UspA family protein